ncbi:uncharacterized protein LOC129234413 isoform X2 [Uloborus diversus]|uniref:uncharacterized protein LOC129234413 isoform X2 n=1 Tax=Uloborus diversus TaxID=327109 RepID=UPI0024095D37|nr:uncharacterized protein LOC129234413 isoform X2 [Uloborus diversus]
MRRLSLLKRSVGRMEKIKKPLVSFGVLTDVQYADCEDRPASYDPSATRFYRGSLAHVNEAFKFWKSSELKVKFVLQLGDIIDGLNVSLKGSHSALQRTLTHFEKQSIPTFHTVGNHELYNFNRRELAELFYESIKKISIPPEVFCPIKPLRDESNASNPILYYKFSPTPRVKCISLDCFDVSVLGYPHSHSNYQEAAKILTAKHKHDIFNDWDCDGSLEGLESRFQQMNGALSEKQLKWLGTELTESDELGQKVIVFGHVSLSPDSTDWNCILWNYESVINTFHQHKCVIAYLSGHSHKSGYAIDSHHISYVVFNGIVETPPDTTSFATVSIFEDCLEIHGHGLEQSYNIPFMTNISTEEIVETDIETSPSTVKVEV